ncbi:aminotransferase class I/II-fold pyridoxal phosphate-dependent enzyme [Leisingera sp. D0M16]|uniref:aminotransferase class I/II-fold pyridoxal phosphate-dependent enzyme n=1 Tax=Leisingera coralii TaxID=3351347 RepID=UPI003B7849AE
MQGVCHNPTGTDRTPERFRAVLEALEARGIFPWIDPACLGFAQSFEADCTMARQIAARFPECIVCIMLCKSFGIYRDRAGALFVKTRKSDRGRMHRAVSAIVRSGESHAPDHGPSVLRRSAQKSHKPNWMVRHAGPCLPRQATRDVFFAAAHRVPRSSADPCSRHSCRQRRPG